MNTDEKHQTIKRLAETGFDFMGATAEMGEEIEKRQQLNKLYRQLAELNETLAETKRDIAHVEDEIWALEEN
jgi:hypothetical protein